MEINWNYLNKITYGILRALIVTMGVRSNVGAVVPRVLTLGAPLRLPVPQPRLFASRIGLLTVANICGTRLSMALTKIIQHRDCIC